MKDFSKKELDYHFLDEALHHIIPFLNEDDVTDISCRESGEIIVKYFGKPKLKTGIILSDDEIQNIIRLSSNAFEAKIDYSKNFPKLETVLPRYGARFTGMLPPCVQKAQFTIRKPPTKVFTLENYLESGRLSLEYYNTIIDYIKNRKNILIGGSTGSGKTTLLNAIIDKMTELTPNDCFYIVEDVPELRCNALEKTIVYVSPEVAPEAVTTVLRWTSDRVIFGELRHGEVCLEFLNVLNTGHTGSASTVHANNAMMMMTRLRELLRMVVKNEIPVISNVIHLFVHISVTEIGPKVDEVLSTETIEKLSKNINQTSNVDDFFSTYEKNYSLN